jgi:DNA-binding NtrC family response regulator
VRTRHESAPALAVQKTRTMVLTSDKVRILVIRPWTEPLAPLRNALREAGIEARISRVDIEPALNAALDRSRFDVVVFDPTTRDISRELLDTCLRDHRHHAPVITFRTLEAAVGEIKHALAARLN